MAQQHSPGQSGSTRRNQMMELGVQAEQAGFAAVWADDHFEPWQDNQGHCGLAWMMLAARSAS